MTASAASRARSLSTCASWRASACVVSSGGGVEGAEGVAASQGHWAGASYIYGAGNCSTHRWICKDSVVKQPQGMHLSEVLGALDDAEKGKREFVSLSTCDNLS